MGKIGITGLLITGLMLFGGSPASAAEMDFEGLPMGTIVTELSEGAGLSGGASGTVQVFGRNSLFGNTNVAIIFDSSCPVTSLSYCNAADLDLGTPNETFGGPGVGIGGEAGSPYQNDTPLGNVIVLAKDLVDSDNDGLVDDPDDADVPGFFSFDFSDFGKSKGNSKKNTSGVTVNSVTLMDIELDEGEVPALIELSGPTILTSTNAISDTGNNGVVTYDGIGLSGVTNMRVYVKGSSAMVGAFFEEDLPRNCWITTGGFQNAGVTSGGKDFTFGGNVGPPPSGSWQVNDHNTGDKFHSNDVHITDCIVLETVTGPGQPGGKKGFDINQAFFAGTGRLNGVPGYPFTGFVIDAGEPQGKKSNDKDEFYIAVEDPDTHVIVFETQFQLDGGNVQIHPPN